MPDEKINNLIKKETNRQRDGLILIASENYASPAVLAAMATPLNNKYSEGYPGRRYYGGNEFVDEIEKLAIERAKKIFGAEHANVQPHSGSQANAAAYLAMLEAGDKILGFDLAAGGHLTHGSPVNFSGIFYDFAYYGVDKKTELIDFDEVEKIAAAFRPKLIIASTTSYSRQLDFEKFGFIAKKVGAYLMADIAHIAGLIVAGEHPHPFPFCDVVTSTTHKTLRGPRGGLILCKKELAEKIDKAVFPGIQGGPFEHVIAAKAICFEEAAGKEFNIYQHQIILNAKAMAEEFKRQGIRVVSGGTGNHMMVLDISQFNKSSKLIEEELAKLNIYVNRNSIPFDNRPPYDPSGIRIGTPATTTRGFGEKETRLSAALVAKLIKKSGNENIKKEIKNEVEKLVKKFPIYPHTN
jgi:glycine hydroxymethyltransferase